MSILVNKYAKDHPQALRSDGTEEPEHTPLTLLLPTMQWTRANHPSGMVAWPCRVLSCAQEFGPDCISMSHILGPGTGWFLALIDLTMQN